ncbi:TPA: hypothetical protein MCB67_000738 [Klebsiella aerogenes]|nr:hypothetical protein [Klebsiella aerogenes]
MKRFFKPDLEHSSRRTLLLFVLVWNFVALAAAIGVAGLVIYLIKRWMGA